MLILLPLMWLVGLVVGIFFGRKVEQNLTKDRQLVVAMAKADLKNVIHRLNENRTEIKAKVHADLVGILRRL